MKFAFFLSVYLFFTSISIAQERLSTSMVKKEEVSGLNYYSHLKSGKPLSGLYKLIESEEEYTLVRFKKGIPDGDYVIYMRGKVVTEGAFVDGKRDGVWKFYALPWLDDNFGYLVAKRSYEKGKVHGISTVYQNYHGRGKQEIVPKEQEGYDQEIIQFKKTFYDDGSLKTHVVYEQGLQHGPYIEYYPNGKKLLEVHYQNGSKTGETISWHPNGQVHQKGQYDASGKAGGRWESWAENGTLTGFVNYSAGKKVGNFESYFDNGQLREKGSYLGTGEFQYTGKYERYYKNGKIAEEAKYDAQGVKHGKATTWHENGNKKHEAEYKNGVVFKKEEHYFNNGQLNESISYSRTEHVKDEWGEHKEYAKQGPYKRHNEDGELVEEGVYKQNKQEGKWKYYLQGKLRRVEHMSDGMNEGLYELYHEGRIRERGNYKIVTDDFGNRYSRKDGVWEEYYYEQYYKPGIKRWEIVYVAGEKHGTSRRYDDKGNLREEEIYENGRLVKKVQHSP